MRRKVLILLLIAVCTVYTVCEGNITAMAAESNVTEVADDKAEMEEPTISIMTTYIEKVYVDLRIDSSECALVSCKISGGSGVTKVSISAVLQKKDGTSWKTVTKWSTSSNSSRVSLSKSKNLSSKGTYRVKGTFKAYKGSKCETQVKYSAEKKVK